jgi:hypothetical protein
MTNSKNKDKAKKNDTTPIKKQKDCRDLFKDNTEEQRKHFISNFKVKETKRSKKKANQSVFSVSSLNLEKGSSQKKRK